MFEERFIQLVEENGGFEFYQAYRNDVDHILGGKGNTYWYVIMKKGKVTESYIGKNSGGAWEDVCVKGSGATQKTKTMPAGSTIRKDRARRKILCKRFSTKSRMGTGKQGRLEAEPLHNPQPWRSERYARRHGVNAGLTAMAY